MTCDWRWRCHHAMSYVTCPFVLNILVLYIEQYFWVQRLEAHETTPIHQALIFDDACGIFALLCVMFGKDKVEEKVQQPKFLLLVHRFIPIE